MQTLTIVFTKQNKIVHQAHYELICISYMDNRKKVEYKGQMEREVNKSQRK